MKTLAIFPGSFNPWHQAHDHVLQKALEVFDTVVVARGTNLNKPQPDTELPNLYSIYGESVLVETFSGTLAQFAEEMNATAIVRGLRNVFDFYEEKDNQYWHEDLGLDIPIFYVISDRELSHISSKAVRIVNQFKK